MEAAGLGVFPETESTSGANGTCINPYFDDPESWDCDCFEEIQKRCVVAAPGTSGGDALVQCFRASFCLHAHVCQEWKDTWCESTSEFQDALQQLASATSSDTVSGLIERA